MYFYMLIFFKKCYSILINLTEDLYSDNMSVNNYVYLYDELYFKYGYVYLKLIICFNPHD